MRPGQCARSAPSYKSASTFAGFRGDVVQKKVATQGVSQSCSRGLERKERVAHPEKSLKTLENLCSPAVVGQFVAVNEREVTAGAFFAAPGVGMIALVSACRDAAQTGGLLLHRVLILSAVTLTLLLTARPVAADPIGLATFRKKFEK